MESFIDNPNPFCIQFIDGYIIQTTPADSESCLALINLAIIAYVNLEEITQQKWDVILLVIIILSIVIM